MSVDVSPNGRTIVFDLLGDLYTVPITGGKAHPLTSGTAFDAQPRFSPDGRYVTFVSDRGGTPNVWVMDRDGRHPRQLSDLRNTAADSPVSSPTWTPDGNSIIVSQRLGAARANRIDDLRQLIHERQWLLASYDVRTRKMQWISDTSFQSARRTLGPVVAPDGRTIYAAVEAYHAGDAVNTWRVERLDRATGVIVPLMTPRVGRGGVRPAVSRDGRFLAYVSSSGSRYGFRILDLRSLRERWLLQERVEVSDYPFGGFDSRDLVPGYAFAPDGTTLIAAVGGHLRRIDLATGRTSIIPFVVDVVRELAPLTVHEGISGESARSAWLTDTSVRVHGVMQPALSPDGTLVAFSALNHVWVMRLPHDNRPAGRPRRLTADSVGEFYPSWSPDGQWIAYSTWQDADGGSIRRVRVDHEMASAGSSEELTSDSALYFHTAFSADGNRIVVVRAEAPAERLLTFSVAEPPRSLTVSWLPATGGPATPVASVALPWGPSRLPAEQLYVRERDDRIYLGLTSFDWHGTGRKTLVLADSDISIPSYNDITGVLSPDCQRALVTHRWALSEIALPRPSSRAVDTLDVEQAQARAFGSELGAAARWGRAITPWISWSRNGRRVLFSQGGALFVGDVQANRWTEFMRVEVPLLVPVDAPHGMLVLSGARIITMREFGDRQPEVIERGDLVVRDNRIVAVGPKGTVPLPPGARQLDVTDKTILPGYIDVHDHPRITYGVHGAQCWPCLTALAYGVTASRNPAPLHMGYGDVFALQDRERVGQLISPRIFSTGVPHYRDDRPVRTLADAREVVRPLADLFGVETFKEYTTSSSGSTRRERQLIARAAAEVGLKATVHSEGISWGLTAITDGFAGVEHTFAVRLYDDVLSFIAMSGVTHTNTYGVIGGFDYALSLPRAPRDIARALRFLPPSARGRYEAAAYPMSGMSDVERVRPMLTSAAGVAARGGCVGLGSHGNLPGIGFHYEMWLHALGGMPKAEILRAATLCGAAAIGFGQNFGGLESGKLADLQVLDKNPLDDIRNTLTIRYVMKNGRLYNVADLTEVWPEHRSLPPVAKYTTWPP
jgi:imidazolonepropionase-like amidohydrolase/Tol biopolymer transport system component